MSIYSPAAIMLRAYRPLLDEMDTHIERGTPFENIPECDIRAMAAHCIKAYGRDAWEILSNADGFNETVSLLGSMMLVGGATPDLYEAMADCATGYLRGTLGDVYREVQEWHEEGAKWDAGLVPVQDRQTGETEWRRYA